MKVPESLTLFFESSYKGVQLNSVSKGGQDCYETITFQMRILDTCVFTLLVAVLVVPKLYKSLSIPKEWEVISLCRKRTSQRICGLRKFLLILMNLLYGAELGYKIAGERCVYLVDTNRVVILMQIFLLYAEPSRTCTSVFRIHLHLLFNMLYAVFYPTINENMLHGEASVSCLLNILAFFVVPPYLIVTGGAYRAEPLKDFTWTLLTSALYGFYIFYVLQVISLLSLVNLGSMLCPGPHDIFTGPNYRWYFTIQQALLVLLFGKIYTLVVYTCMKVVEVIRTRKDGGPQLNGECFVQTFIEDEKSK